MTITRSPLRLGIVGLGAVGLATVKILQDQANMLAERAGRPIQIVAVCARNATRDRGVDLSSYRWYDDALALTQADDIDVVIELIGGAEGAARALVTTALQKGNVVCSWCCTGWPC
jgi:homoserine dehydrogenase